MVNNSIKTSNLIFYNSFALIILLSSYDAIVRFLSVGTIKIVLYALILLLMILLVCRNRFMNKRAVAFLFVVFAVIILNYCFAVAQQQDYIFELFLSVPSAIRLWSYIIIFSLVSDSNRWEKALVRIAYINMAILIPTVMLGLYASANRELNYLGLGITSAVWISVIIQEAFINSEHRKINITCSGLFLLFIAVYGNRGSFVAVCIFIAFCFIRYTKMKRKISMAFVCVLISYIVYRFQKLFLASLISCVSKLGIYSRNMTLMLHGEISSTTHRADSIWVTAIDAIAKKPITGYGLCYDRVLGGAIDGYAHNLALELWISFGVIVGSFLLGIHLYFGIKYCFAKFNGSWLHLFAPFYITTTVLLMFNSSFCQLSYFWIPYGVLFAYYKTIKQKRVIV